MISELIDILSDSESSIDISAITKLLSQSIDVNSRIPRDDYFIFSVIKTNQVMILLTLLRKGVSLTVRNTQGMTPLKLAMIMKNTQVISAIERAIE